MILLLDIWNKSTKVVTTKFQNNKFNLQDISYFHTKLTLTNFENSAFFLEIIKPNKFKFLIVVSVVKEFTEKLNSLNNQKIIFFEKILEKVFVKLIAEKASSLMNKMSDPSILSKVGSDILAMYYYFLDTDVSSNKLIFSLGTTNVAIFIKNNVLEGCLISLGLEPSANEISNYCSLINEKPVRFDRFSFLVKQDTISSIEDGSLYQTAGFCELVGNSYVDQEPVCYLTGGNAKYVKFLLSKRYIKIGNLVIKGLLKFLNQNLIFFT